MDFKKIRNLFFALFGVIITGQTIAAASDYDGKWNGLISCSVHASNPKLGPFTRNNIYTIDHGRISATYTTSGGKSTLTSNGSVNNGVAKLTIEGTNGTAQWVFNFNGATSSAEKIVFTGSMLEQGAKQRDCSMEFTATEPALASLAYKKAPPTAVVAQIKNSASVSAPPAVPPSVAQPSPTIPTSASAPAPKAPAKVDTSPSQPPLESLETLMWKGTDDETRIKQMIATLIAKDTPPNQPSREDQLKKSAAEDANLTLAVLNSLDALGLNIFLDKSDPMFKRDLSGNATLGDGKMPIRILLLNSMTRIQGRNLLQSAALTLGLATDPAKASTDTGDYRQTLGNLLGKLLKEKGIQPAPSPQGGMPQFSIEFVPVDWAQNRDEALELIGRRFPIIVAFDALIDPAEGTDVVLYRQTGTKAANLRQRQTYEQRVAQFKARLSQKNFEVLGTPSVQDLVTLRTAQVTALSNERDRLEMEMLSRIARIDEAVLKKTELAGALRIYPKGKTLTANPKDVFCTVTTNDALLLKGLAASAEFVNWSKISATTRFTEVLDSPNAMYEAIKVKKCGVVIDHAINLKRYMTAIVRDDQFAFNVGPVVSREEAMEPFAMSLGYQGWAEYAFAEAIGGRTPTEMQALKTFGIADQISWNEAVVRMQQSKYASDAADLPQFLADEAEGKAVGKSAVQVRKDENNRIEGERKALERAEKERLERIRKAPVNPSTGVSTVFEDPEYIKRVAGRLGPDGYARCAVGQIAISALAARDGSISKDNEGMNNILGFILSKVRLALLSKNYPQSYLDDLFKVKRTQINTGDKAFEVVAECLRLTDSELR